MSVSRIPPSRLRWRVDPKWLTGAGHGAADTPPAPEQAVSQITRALELALRAGNPHRRHVFIRAEPECDRTRLLEAAIRACKPGDHTCPDFCYVHNFDHPDRPRLIALPAGGARNLRAELREISHFIRNRLQAALQARPVQARLNALIHRAEAEMNRHIEPLEADLKTKGLALLREPVGQLMRLTIHVRQTGRVITQDDLANLVASGQVSEQEYKQLREHIRKIQPRLREVAKQVELAWSHAHKLRARVLRMEAKRLMADLAEPLRQRFDLPAVEQQFEQILADVIEKRVDKPTEHLADPDLLYGAHLLHIADETSLPIVHEPVPSVRNLAGTIDPSWLEQRRSVASFHGIRAGSLIAAGNGLLIVDAADLLGQKGSIELLRNAMSNQQVHIEAPPEGMATAAISLRPDPVPVQAALVVNGTMEHWSRLQREHPDFLKLFSAPVDIPSSVPRERGAARWLADRLRSCARQLKPAEASDEALAALVEHAARLGGPNQLSIRLAELESILVRAALEASLNDDQRISTPHVEAAIESSRTRARINLPGKREPGTFPSRQHQPGKAFVLCSHDGGQGLRGQVVRVQVGLARGHPSRIRFGGDCTSAGSEPGLRIESLLTQLLHLEEPANLRVIFDCRVSGEPGRIEFQESLLTGAMLALLSQLSGIPIRQDLAAVGGLDGEAMLVVAEGLNEQIEDAWQWARQITTDRIATVVVPSRQLDALMLRPALVKAVSNDLFQVVSANSLAQLLELYTGAAPGTWRDGRYPPDSLLGRARANLIGRSGNP